MGRVIEARRIRDKMPRWLWEMKVECGHFHYELVEKHPSAPANVLCRVCASTQRVRRWIATLSERELDVIRGHPVLSELAPEKLKRRPGQASGVVIPQQPVVPLPFRLDGGISAEAPAPPAEPEPQAPAPEARRPQPLPACMRPRPGAAVPRPRDLASGPVPEATKAAKAAPKARRRGPDPDQGTLFDV